MLSRVIVQNTNPINRSAAAVQLIYSPACFVLTKEDPSDHNVGVIPLWVFHIAKAQGVELLISCAAHDMHRKQNGPGYRAPNETHYGHDLQKSNEEISVQGRMPKDLGIWQP